ncbi:sensor histidine kinase [Planctomycetota bacterium]
MKLTAKLISVVILAFAGLLAVDGLLSVHYEIALFESDMKRDALLLGRTVKGMIRDVWDSGGDRRVVEIVEGINEEEHHVRVRWVYADTSADGLHAPQAPLERLEPVARGEEISFIEHSRTGDPQFLTYVPVAVPGGRRGAVELSESLDELEAFSHQARMRLALLLGILVLVGGVIVVVLGILVIGRPLRRLVEKTRRVGEGDLSGPIELRGRNELTELAEALNAMCKQIATKREQIRQETAARIAALEQLRHADRLQTIGQLASGIAHELGTPLNVVSGRAGIIARGNLSPAAVVENANIIKAQTGRMTLIIRQVLDFARRRSGTKTGINIHQIVRQAFDLVTSLARKQRVELSLDDSSGPIVAVGDRAQLQQVLTNLIVNAVQAMPKGGVVEVEVGQEHVTPPEGQRRAEPSVHVAPRQGEHVRISIRDEGGGITEEDLNRVFEPFFTTKEAGEGTGLGLSIAHDIVDEHGGWIDVDSEVGKGSRFSVYLPIDADEEAPCLDAS